MLGTPSWHPFVLLLAALERFLYANAEAYRRRLLPGSERHIRAVCGKASKIHWIPNGVDVDATADVRPTVDGGVFVAMYAGAHGIPNGLDTLIQAAAIVQAADQERGAGSDRPLRVVLIGDGKEKGSLKRLAHELGATNVSFRDPVAKSEIPALLRAADVLVLTLVSSPVFKDGISPNKLFDYMGISPPRRHVSRHPPRPGAGVRRRSDCPAW